MNEVFEAMDEMVIWGKKNYVNLICGWPESKKWRKLKKMINSEKGNCTAMYETAHNTIHETHLHIWKSYHSEMWCNIHISWAAPDVFKL